MSQFGLILLTVGLTCAAAAIVIDMVSLPPRARSDRKPEPEDPSTLATRRWAIRAGKSALVVMLYLGIMAKALDPEYSGAWISIGMVLAFGLTWLVDMWAYSGKVKAPAEQ